MEILIDLHIHSNKSDGDLTPFQIIDEAKKNNVEYISIADHDTVDAYSTELFEYAKKNNIKIIPGVEISTKTNSIGVHILGYNFELNNEKLKKALYNSRNSRKIYLEEVSKKLEELGYIINTKKLATIDSVSKAHIAKDIVNNKENHKQLIKKYGYVPQMGEFIETVMNFNCPAYVEKNSLTPKEASNIIKEAGGKVILAHPVAYKYEDDLTEEQVINIAKNAEVDGIEANYIYVDRNQNVIKESEKWKKVAKDNNFITTIGSDFHNFNEIYAQIGLTNYLNDFKDVDTNYILDEIK